MSNFVNNLPVYARPNVVALNVGSGAQRFDKLVSGAVVPVGSLIQKDGSSGVKLHATKNGRAEAMFAEEHSLEGLLGSSHAVGNFDDYAIGDMVRCLTARPGDTILARLAGGQNVTEGQMLASNGDGTLIAVVDPATSANQLYESVADSAAVTASSTETAFDKSYTLPANTLRVGDIIRVRAQALATATNSTDTLTLKLYIGATVIVATAAVDVANNDEGFITAELVVRTIGASGTIVGNGVQALGVPGTVTAKPFNLLSTAIDTTATQLIKVTATWSTTDAGNSVLLKQMNVTLDRGSQYNTTAESASITNTTVATAFDKTYTIAGNSLNVGDVIRIRAQGIAPTTNSTDTLTVTLKIGTTTIIATAAVNVADNDVFFITADVVIRTIGATGTFVANGTQTLGVVGTATALPWNKVSTAIDTTAAQTISVFATWSVASASNIVTLSTLSVAVTQPLTTPYPVAVAAETLDLSILTTGYLRVQAL